MRKLKKFLINLIPNKELRHKKWHEQKKKYQRVDINKKIHGDGNIIEGDIPFKVKIEIYGNNNRIVFEDNLKDFRARISIGSKSVCVDNCLVHIGSSSTSGETYIRLLENNSEVIIGQDCMLSWNIDIWCSDCHSVLDARGKVINSGQSIKIGNHVWIGKDVKIGKNTEISDNSIIGWKSVVTKKFDKAGVVIAGNPAKIVKENINWDRKTPSQFLSD